MSLSHRSSGMNSALCGMKVVDLSGSDAGASCAEALAWFGADVIKIEEPTHGDRRRYATTGKPGIDSHAFILLNANKRSVTCDIDTESGKEILRKLIAKADALIEDLAAGAIERLGFGYDVVRELNPQLIYAQIKGFASSGPYANYLSSDMVAQAVGGTLSVTGIEGGPPLIPGPAIGDTGTALHCVMGILAALHQRQAIGHGQRAGLSIKSQCRRASLASAWAMRAVVAPRRAAFSDVNRVDLTTMSSSISP